MNPAWILCDGYHVLSPSYPSIKQMTVKSEGKFAGRNLLSQLDFLPAKDTDLYAVTTEALGFAGIAVIVLFYLLLMRTMRAARRSRDTPAPISASEWLP